MVVGRLLSDQPKIICSIFDPEAMCFLLCGEDARGIRALLSGSSLAAPMDLFLSNLDISTLDAGMQYNVQAMALYLRHCPNEFLQDTAKRLATRMRIWAQPSPSSRANPRLQFHLEALLNMMQFIELLITANAAICHELLAVHIDEHIVEVLQACHITNSIDKYTVGEIGPLLPLCLACHRTILHLLNCSPGNARVELCRHKVLTAVVHTSNYGGLLLESDDGALNQLYDYSISLLSERYVTHQDR